MSDDKDVKTFTVEDIERERAHAQHFKTQLDEVKTRLKVFEGIDPEEVQRLRSEVDSFKKKGAVGDEKAIDALIAEKESEIRRSVQKQLDELTSQRDTTARQLKELRVVDRAIAECGSKFVPQAHDDFRRLVRETCDLSDDGQVVIRDANGKVRMSPKNITAPLSLVEYAEEVATEKPHWAASNFKGGAHHPAEKVKTNGGAPALTLAEINKLPDPKGYLKTLTPEQVLSLARNVTFK